MSRSIHSDIQQEIIKRLPVESLIRFRSVCKAWKSLIDCSEFIAAYSLRQTQRQHLLVRHEVGKREEIEVKHVSFVDDDTFPQQKVAFVPPLSEILYANGSSILGSSHGLLCCYYHEQNMAVLWNPSIRKSIVIVVPNVLKEPFSSVVGFGVCPDTGDPKLVKVTYIRSWLKTESVSYIPWQVMVFSLSSKEWTKSSNNLPRKSIEFTLTQAVVGQIIYWIAFDRIVEKGRNHNLIMSFNLSTKEFREVNLPDSLVHLRFISLSISRLRESLALLEYTEDITDIAEKPFCVVWMMEHGDPKSFTKLYTIKSPHTTAPLQRALGFRKSGEPIILHCYFSTLVTYETFSEHFTDLGILANRFFYSLNSYKESLLLLNEEDDSIYYIQIDDEDDGLIAKCGAVKRLVLEQPSEVLRLIPCRLV